MNLYASLGQLKGEVLAGRSDTGDDAALIQALEDASRWIDGWCHRAFYATQATRVFDGSGKAALWLPDGDELTAITTLKADLDGDLVYEYTLAAGDDYLAWPDQLTDLEPAYRRIDLNPLSTQLTTWPNGRRRVQITGTFGMWNEYEASGTLGAAIADAVATAVTMTASHGLTGGETILVDSEQMWVSAVSTNTLTVVRGVNGTTAAAHSNATAVTRRRYPRGVARACRLRAGQLFRAQQAGFMAGTLGSGDEGTISASPNFAVLVDLLAPYRPVGVV